MSTIYQRTQMAEIRHNLSLLQSNWGWFVVLGVAMIALGAFTCSSAVVATLATAMIIGATLIVGGLFEIVGAFWSRAWSGFLLHLLFGVLAFIVGLLFLRAPLNAALSLTLLMACLLMAGGLFTVISSVAFQFSGWGLRILGGVVDFILGLLIWMEWPASALWVLGLFLGISFIFRGVMWIALGFALRSYRQEALPGGVAMGD